MTAVPDHEKAPGKGQLTTGHFSELKEPTSQTTQSQAPISTFPRVTDKSPTGQTTVAEFMRGIHDGDHAEVVASVREAIARGDKPAADAIKRALPAVTLSGLVTGDRAKAFDQGRFLHSGWMQADLDKKDLGGADPATVRDSLVKDPHVQAAFVSASGEGVKAIVKVHPCESPNEHLRAFESVERHFLKCHGLRIDPSTKDPCRLCFASHDPAAAWNGSPMPLPVLPEDTLDFSPPLMMKIANPAAFSGNAGTSLDQLPEILRFIAPRPAYEEWLRICSGAWNEFGESATPHLAAWSPEENLGEYAAKFPQRLRDVGIGTLVMLARERGYSKLGATASHFASAIGSSIEPPPFPLHCLPGTAGDMAREIGRVTTAQNLPLAAVSVIAIISAAIGAGLKMSTGGERWTRANPFILIIAESGTGKGEAYSLAAKPFEVAESEAVEAFNMHTKPGLIAELKVAEKRADKLCDVAAKASDPFTRQSAIAEFKKAGEELAVIQKRIKAAPCWKVADVTKEALALVMAGQPGEACASLSSEARGIFSIVKGRYGKEGGDEDFYCSGYSGDSLKVDRVGRDPVILTKPCLMILWMVQPDAARKAFADSSLMESGMIPRFLMFDPKAEPQEREGAIAPIPHATKEQWATLIRSLATEYRMNGDEPRTVSVAPGASAIFRDYENENIRRRQRKGDLRDLGSFVARWTENALKIALILHAARHGPEAHIHELDTTTAKNALEVMRWFSNRQLEVLSASRQEKLKSRLSALLAVLASANGEISLRDLRRSHSFDDEEIKQLHSHYPKAFKIETRKPETGRPSLVVTTGAPLEDMKVI